MGFMGMGCVCDSDAASDLKGRVADRMVEEFLAELESEHSRWNTPGFVNVALVFEEVVIPGREFIYHDDLVGVAKKCIKKLQHRVNNKHPQDKFGNDYRRMINSLQKFVRQSKL